MRVLFLNNYYYIRGGSERVFFGEMELMKKHGHEIAGFARRHPMDQPSEFSHLFPPDIATENVRISWEAFRTVNEMFFSRIARAGLDRLISQFRPDVAHVHNIYGRLTTSVLDLLSERKIPVVMTLHDHKLVCPTYRFMRNGSVCEDCGGGRYYMALKNRCHKESYAASAIVALESYYCDWFNKYKKNVRFFLSPSTFLKRKLVEFGWPANQIMVLPNFLDLTKFEPNYAPGGHFLYLGRLSEEKGVATLILSFLSLQNTEARLVIVGEGPLRAQLEALAADDHRIRFAGYLAGDALREVTREAVALIIPSECYENAPISVLEAMAYGKPVIGADIGGIPEMVRNGENGLLFRSGDFDSLKRVMETFLGFTPHGIDEMGRTARLSVENGNTADAHYRKLMDIYRDVI